MAGIEDWLKRNYKDAPESKRVKFSDILEEASQEHPVVSNSMLSDAIRTQFPHSSRKRAGDHRHTYVHGIEKGEANPLEAANHALQQQVRQLEQRVHQLEQESALARKLSQQMQSLVNLDMQSYHGPDTVAHLENFSIDDCIAEFQANAPDVVELVRQLGDCDMQAHRW